MTPSSTPLNEAALKAANNALLDTQPFSDVIWKKSIVRAIIEAYLAALPMETSTASSLVEAIKERQWDYGKYPAVYVDDVEEIVRQHGSEALPRVDEVVNWSVYNGVATDRACYFVRLDTTTDTQYEQAKLHWHELPIDNALYHKQEFYDKAAIAALTTLNQRRE